MLEIGPIGHNFVSSLEQSRDQLSGKRKVPQDFEKNQVDPASSPSNSPTLMPFTDGKPAFHLKEVDLEVGEATNIDFHILERCGLFIQCCIQKDPKISTCHISVDLSMTTCIFLWLAPCKLSRSANMNSPHLSGFTPPYFCWVKSSNLCDLVNHHKI